MLMYEILLIRVCAIRLAFHFGFLVISNCLLAIGASGTLITLQQERFKARTRFWLLFFSIALLLSFIFVYVFLCIYPVMSELTGQVTLSDPKDFFHFFFFNLVAAVPFFFGGAVVGMLLTFHPPRVNRLYFVDLVAAALGCLISPVTLAAVGAGGCMVLLWLLALLGTMAAVMPERRRTFWAGGAVLFVLGLFLMPKLERILPVRARVLLELSREIQVLQNPKAVAFTKWTATSRIDMIYFNNKPPAIYGMGTKHDGLPPLPEEAAITQDANAGTVMVNFSEHPDALENIRHSTYSASVRLKKNPRVFIIGVGGGNDIWAAYAANASYVKGVELNGFIIDIHKTLFPRFTKTLTSNPNIHFVVDEGRSALMRDSGRYDVIQLTGVDTWTGLKSGAYVLAENYLYTAEALRNMYHHLADGGILQFIRMAESMEAVRMVSNLYAAFPSNASAKFERSIIVLKTPDVMATFMVKPSGFSSKELLSTARFLEENGIDPLYLPGKKTNTPVERFVLSKSKADFIKKYPRNISPTSDDSPYFFNFNRWNEPWKSREYAGELSSVSQGNPFFLLVQLILSVVLSFTFIVAPLFGSNGSKPIDRRYLGRFLTYFSGVGLGFIMLEVSLLQRFTVFLGHPIYSITVTLASILFFAGLGSLISGNWFNTDHKKSWLIPLGLLALTCLLLILWPHGMAVLIKLPLSMRVATAIVVMAPVGLLLGVPFAYGLRLLNRYNPTFVPWAWAVNGCFSVVGSILTVIISMAMGFTFTFLLAVGVYLLAFGALAGIGNVSSGGKV
jgi:hypothetical protein